MAKIASVKLTLKDADNIKTVWEAIPDFKLGPISLTDFITVYDAAAALDKEYAKKDVELTGVKNNRDDKTVQLNELLTRFRSGIRAAYGPNSPEYGQAGATLDRQRKAPRPKTQATSA